MCLEPSTYATMAVREITKKDTSASAQVLLSAAAVSSRNDETSLNTVTKRAVAELPTDIAVGELSCRESSVCKEEILDSPQKECAVVAEETNDKDLTSEIQKPPIGHCISDSAAPNFPDSADEKEHISSIKKVAPKRKVEDVSDDSDAGKRAKESYETLD